MESYTYLKWRTKWITNCWSSSRGVSQSSTKSSSAAVSSNKRKIQVSPTKKILPKKNSSSSMLSNLKSTTISSSKKRESSSSTPRTSAMSISSSAPQFAPPNSASSNCTITKNAPKGLADTFSMKNLILPMSFRGAFRALPTWLAGRRETVST
jgi:hypothetical protein